MVCKRHSRSSEVPRLNIRPARVGDVPAIYELIRIFAERKLMIRRSMGELYESIREFLVAMDDEGRVVGCVALHVFWEDLAELRCLAVAEHLQGQGVGRQLVDACWESARELEIASVFTLTHAAGFFERCGYHQVDKAELPHKIWNECVRCPLFPNCQEVALIRSVDPEWSGRRPGGGTGLRRGRDLAERPAARIRPTGRPAWRSRLATAVAHAGHRAAPGDRLGRGIHPRPRGPAAGLVPRGGRPARFAASWRPPSRRAGPVGPTPPPPAGRARLPRRSCSSTPASWPGSGRSPARSRTAIRRSTRCWAWPATSSPRRGHDLPRARLGPILAVQPDGRGDLRVRRRPMGPWAAALAAGLVGLPAEPVRPRALRRLRRRPARRSGCWRSSPSRGRSIAPGTVAEPPDAPTVGAGR